MNEYTPDDLMVLIEMVNANIDRINDNTIECYLLNKDNIGSDEIHTSGRIIPKLYDKEDMKKYPIEQVINKITHSLAYGDPRETMLLLIYEEPIENVPLYINKPDNIGFIAKWRLQIGK